MNFTYENQGANTYLVYTIRQEDRIDTMSLGMLTNNSIPGLTPVLFTQMNMTQYLKYNVSAKLSVKQFFEGAVNKKRLLGVFQGIVDAMLSAEEYMLPVSSIILDLDYIFTDVSTCESVLICLPIVSDKNDDLNLKDFFRNIVFSTQFDSTENCEYVAKIINYLNMAGMLILSDFKELLEQLGEDAVHYSFGGVKRELQPTVPVSGQKTIQQVAVQSKDSQFTVKSEPIITKQQPCVPQKKQEPKQLQIPQETPQESHVFQQQNSQSVEKGISFFYLMQHYNKENAAAYKAQKEARKREKGGNNSAGDALQAEKFKETNITGSDNDFGFAIPNQSPAEQIQGKNVISQVQNVVRQPQNQVTQQQMPQTLEPQMLQSTHYVYTPPAEPQGRHMNFGETTVLGMGQIGETTVLTAESFTRNRCPHLIRVRNNERIDVDKPVFHIGKEKSYADYFIGDNTAISRSHANIITRGEEYFVVDTNSTNHTFVNETMIISNQEVKISHGDKICFANEEYEFRIY